jgi:Tfp pilus assembly protein PilO
MKITQRDKKFLIVGGIAVILFVLLKFLLLPFWDQFSGQKEDLMLKEMTLERYIKFMAKQGEFQRKLKLLQREERKINNSLLRGETTSLAAADIQKIIDRIATQSDIDIQSVKIMNAGQQGPFTTIPIQVRFTSDPGRMVNFIDSVEKSQKLLTIPELKIRVKNRRNPKEIIVTMIVRGFMKKEASMG